MFIFYYLLTKRELPHCCATTVEFQVVTGSIIVNLENEGIQNRVQTPHFPDV